MCPEVVKYDYAERSFHNTLASHGFVPFIGKRHITAKKADEYEAFNLGLNKDDLLYFCETHTYDKEGRLLEYTVSRTDILKMSISLETTNQPIILKKEDE